MKIRDRKFAKLTTDELHDILKLRIDVFVAEQACAYPELDGRDTEPTTRHVGWPTTSVWSRTCGCSMTTTHDGSAESPPGRTLDQAGSLAP